MNQPNGGRPAVKSVSEIRTLDHSEASALSRIESEFAPTAGSTAGRFSKKFGRLRAQGGRGWLVRRGESVAGYAALWPAPGLPGLYEIEGFIAPAHQRQGLATFLFRTMIDDLAGSDVRQLYHTLSPAGTPAARFLAAMDFYPEHEERVLTLDDLEKLPPAQITPGYTLRTLARQEAIGRFRRLYDEIFAGLPWYQPYASDQEVAADLADEGDLLFLERGRQTVAILWLRWPSLDTAEIEPVGVLSQYRGLGLGRQIMLAGVNQAAQQGARQVAVGTWRQNTGALALYKGLGFRETQRRIFVAYDVKPAT